MPGEDPKIPPKAYTALFTRTCVGLRLGDLRYFIPSNESHFGVAMSFVETPTMHKFSIGANYSAQGLDPITVQAVLLPSAFLHMAHKAGTTVKLESGMLTINGKNGRAEVDAKSGRMREIFQPGTDADTCYVVKTGELAAKIKDLREDPSFNYYDEKRSIGSFVRFAAEAAISIRAGHFQGGDHEKWTAASKAIDKVLTPEA